MFRIEHARTGKILRIGTLDACLQFIEQHPRLLLWARVVRVSDGAVVA